MEPQPQPSEITADLTRYLQSEILNDALGRDIHPTEDLLGTDMVDSMGMLRFIGYIENRYQIVVQPEDQVIENFMSIEHIVRFVQGKQSSSSRQ